MTEMELNVAEFDQLDARARDLGRRGERFIDAYRAMDAALAGGWDVTDPDTLALLVHARNRFVRMTGAALEAEVADFADSLAYFHEHNAPDAPKSDPEGMES